LLADNNFFRFTSSVAVEVDVKAAFANTVSVAAEARQRAAGTGASMGIERKAL